MSSAADLSSTGKLKVGSYTQTFDGTLSGADAANYLLLPLSAPNSYIVTP